jgi:hypothetical protein
MPTPQIPTLMERRNPRRKARRRVKQQSLNV